MKWSQLNINSLSDHEYQRWYALMDEEGKARVDRFYFPDDKKRTIVGELLARKAISDWCGVPEDLIQFGSTKYGKPFAAGLPVEFHISHSGDIVVCAISDIPVGIDVEMIRPVDPHLTRRICTDNDLIYLFGHYPREPDWSAPAKRDFLIRFFRIWTAKEAYFKCLGTGISDLKSIEYASIRQMHSFSQFMAGYWIVSLLEASV